MRRIHLTIGVHLQALSDPTYASKAFGRLLVGLIAFLMTAMMYTERFLTWDRFLQGGQDLELSLIALVVFLCLIILLAQRSRQAVDVQLFLCRLWSQASAAARLFPALRSSGETPSGPSLAIGQDVPAYFSQLRV